MPSVAPYAAALLECFHPEVKGRQQENIPKAQGLFQVKVKLLELVLC